VAKDDQDDFKIHGVVSKSFPEQKEAPRREDISFS
jgi:hypothetical protein